MRIHCPNSRKVLEVDSPLISTVDHDYFAAGGGGGVAWRGGGRIGSKSP